MADKERRKKWENFCKKYLSDSGRFVTNVK